MARRDASLVSVSARWAAVPPATTVDAISELRRASSPSTEVTRTGIPPWASMRAYSPAPADAISRHTCPVCASSPHWIDSTTIPFWRASPTCRR